MTGDCDDEMNCCVTDDNGEAKGPEPNLVISRPAPSLKSDRCLTCNQQARPVSRKTVLLMLKPELLEQATSVGYRLCGTKDCPVVYFADESRHFRVDDLRVRVGLKVKSDPIPLCYCFGFDEAHLRDEITVKGCTTIPERISKLIREGLCTCDTRNPAGVCCLGEVNNAVKRLRLHQINSEEVDGKKV
jgi:Zinc binding domain